VVVAALVVSAESGRDTDAKVNAGKRDEPMVNNDATSTSQAPAKNYHGMSDKPKPAPNHEPDRSIAVQPSNRALRFDLGAAVGSGVEGHGARYGGILRPSIALTPHLFLWGAVSGSHAAEPVSVNWVSGAFGLGGATKLGSKWAIAEARLAPVVSRLSLTATDAQGASDSASRWRFGVGAGLDAVFQVGDSWGIFVGIDAALALPRVKIQTAGNDVGQVPTTEALVSAGFRWRIPLTR